MALSPCNQYGVNHSSQDEDQCQHGRASVADLVGHSKHNPGQNEMHQRSGLAIRKLKESNHQPDKAGDRYYIKKRCHLSAIPLIAGQNLDQTPVATESKAVLLDSVSFSSRRLAAA
jgi:hypothetical protein